MSSNKIYELRTYDLKPDKFADYLKLIKEKFDIRTAHSKLCGFWTTDIGDKLNQVVHLWEYDSYCHRAAVRSALTKDERWNTEFIPYSKPMIVKQKNVMLRPASWYPVRDPDVTGGIYELRRYTFDPSKRDEIERLWAPVIPHRNKYKEAIGIWFTEVGTLNEIYSLWSYKDGDERSQARKTAFEDEVLKKALHTVDVHFTMTKNSLLHPTTISPWN
ncbi:protein NipSnap homolog 3A [Exaiptasia diaphana]|uniref:NIPSNAP domain-containing protein n=1 Tax=Exaiptasia diaphana TaxID=2652724 RepID=A0A913XU82_EXADI|nr:protein NipSnap homolog 3A [Exaiptasia diaphana]